MSDIFVTWDRATLEFENSNLIADGIITLAWHKQQIVILENVSSTCYHWPNKVYGLLDLCES